MVGEPDTAVIFLNVWGDRDTDAGKRTRRKIVSFVCWLLDNKKNCAEKVDFIVMDV